MECLELGPRGPRKLTLALMGLDNSGKTSLVKAVRGDRDPPSPTWGFSSKVAWLSMRPPWGDKRQLELLDLGGARTIRRIWQAYTPEAHGIIFVVDASDASRWPEARQALEAALAADPHARGKAVLVVANKCEAALPGAAAAVAALAAEVLAAAGASWHFVAASTGPPAAWALASEPSSPGTRRAPPLLAWHAPGAWGAGPAVVAPEPSTCSVSGAGQAASGPTLGAIQRGLRWLVRECADEWATLGPRVRREAAAALAAELQRKREREQRAAKEERARADAAAAGEEACSAEPGAALLTKAVAKAAAGEAGAWGEAAAGDGLIKAVHGPAGQGAALADPLPGAVC